MSNLLANWPAPSNIVALTTSRTGGFSSGNYAANNLALHVNDDAQLVRQNRQALSIELQLPNEPHWLDQTHSCTVVNVDFDSNRIADAAITRTPNQVLAILTADCLPIILCDAKGQEIAAIHAGWKGLINGIIEETLRGLTASRDMLIAWLGPAICGKCYAISDEMRINFLSQYPAASSGFYYIGTQTFADLAVLATLILQQNGIFSIHAANTCTYEQKNRFYSYRREKETGRMVTLIWFKEF